MREIPDHLQGKFSSTEAFLLNCIRDQEKRIDELERTRPPVAPDGYTVTMIGECPECGIIAGHRGTCSQSAMRGGRPPVLGGDG